MYKISYTKPISIMSENIRHKINKNINLDNYELFNKHNIKNTNLMENINNTVSESPNFPEFPNGNSPPNIDYIRLIYLNYLANNSLIDK